MKEKQKVKRLLFFFAMLSAEERASKASSAEQANE